VKWITRTSFVNKGGADENEQAQANFYNTLTTNYNTDFGQFEGLTQGLLSKLEPIVNAGPGQYGFDATEDSAIRSSAINADAAAAQNAEEATNKQIIASNGGADLMPTGAQEQLREEGNVSAAQKLASDMSQITQAGYQAGQQNYNTALGAEENVMGLMNPNSYASSAVSGGSAATGAVNAEMAADDSWMNMVGGALGGAAGAFTSWGIKKAKP
jgi:hypothetical protein